MTMTIQIPAELELWLKERARLEHKEPQAIALELLNQKRMDLERVDEKERETQWLQQLYDEGLLVNLSDDLKAKIIPGVTHEEVRQMLAKAGGKPLSEIVIEQRGPKDWQITSSTPARSSNA